MWVCVGPNIVPVPTGLLKILFRFSSNRFNRICSVQFITFNILQFSKSTWFGQPLISYVCYFFSKMCPSNSLSHWFHKSKLSIRFISLYITVQEKKTISSVYIINHEKSFFVVLMLHHHLGNKFKLQCSFSTRDSRECAKYD